VYKSLSRILSRRQEAGQLQPNPIAFFAHGEERGLWVYFTFTVYFPSLTIDVRLRLWMLWMREGVGELRIAWG
jgi:hypothetical protein